MCCYSYMVKKEIYDEFVKLGGGTERKLYCVLGNCCSKSGWWKTDFELCCHSCNEKETCERACKNHPDRCNCWSLTNKVTSGMEANE